VTAGSTLDQMARIGVGAYNRTTMSLEALAAAGAAAPAAIWNFVLTSVPAVINGAGTTLLKARNLIQQLTTGEGRG